RLGRCSERRRLESTDGGIRFTPGDPVQAGDALAFVHARTATNGAAAGRWSSNASAGACSAARAPPIRSQDAAMNDPPPTSSRAARRCGAILLLIGVLLRLHGLEVHSMWFDETASLAIAVADDPIAALREDRHPPLFLLLLRAWRALVGEGDTALRLLPALIGIGSLLGTSVVAHRLLPRPAALLATSLFAVAPFQIWYAQDLRMYPLLEFGAVLALLGATGTGPLAARSALLAGGAAVAMGSHYFGFLVPPLCAPFVWQGWNRRSACLVLAPLAGCAAWTPWLVTVLPVQMQTKWGFHAKFGARDLLELPGRWFVVLGANMPAWLPIAIAGLVVSGMAAAAALALLRDRAARVLLASLALAALAVGFEFVVLPAVLTPYYAIAASPVATLLVAHGFAGWLSVRTRSGGLLGIVLAGLGIGLAVACLSGTLILRGQNLKDDVRGATADLARAWAPGDAVVAVTGTPELFSQACLRHYLRDQPGPLAAVRDLHELLAALERGERPVARVQVLWRARPYALPDLGRLRAVAREVHTGALREAGLQHRTFEVGR
ncbi:MAG TPA: glycosyltransferase family 39 protein, partial [Planctomycetota bacterium]|nr:glycosyltransferase family 39 protein [Planctomycetota bacterium]